MGDKDCIIQINNTGDWVEKVKGEVRQLSERRSMEKKQWERESIYRIPWSLKKLSSGAYQPQRVSIGPYHHGAKSLNPMEKHKHRAFLKFLDRKKKPLDRYVNALEREVEKLMGAYDQLQPKWKQNREAFHQLMIVDACFILELMETATVTAKTDAALEKMGYDAIDPVFGRQGHLYVGPCLRRDMLMLENQIPLQVLYIILFVADGGDLVSKQKDLIERILVFFDQSHKPKGSSDADVEKFDKCFRRQPKSKGCGGGGDDDTEVEKHLHILDLYRKNQLLGLPPKKRRYCLPESCRSKEEVEPYIRSATELAEAGIRFEKSKTRKLDDVSFECGVLKLPVIEVDDLVEAEYLNMMALERLHGAAGSEVTSYVILMDKIIDSAKDVSLLHWCRIIRNSLGNDDAVAALFNSLSREACLDYHNRLVQVQKEVTQYYRSPPRRCVAYAKHNYFTNPWVSLSVLAAIFLFALTTVQTVYALLDYYRPA